MRFIGFRLLAHWTRQTTPSSSLNHVRCIVISATSLTRYGSQHTLNMRDPGEI